MNKKKIINMILGGSLFFNVSLGGLLLYNKNKFENYKLKYNQENCDLYLNSTEIYNKYKTKINNLKNKDNDNKYKYNKLETILKKETRKNKELEILLEDMKDIEFKKLSPYYENYKKRLLKYHYKTIKESAKRYNIPEKLFIAKLVYERGSKTSPTGRIGPGQMTFSSFEDSLNYIYSKKSKTSPLWEYSIKLKKLENETKKTKLIKSLIYNKDYNIEAAAAYLSKMHSIFPEWSLSLFAYHLGPSIVADLVWFYKGKITKSWYLDYLKRDRKKDRFQYYGLKNIGHMKKFIKKYKINYFKLMNDRSVLGYYKRLKNGRKIYSKFYNEEYPIKVISIMKSLKRNYNS